MAKVIVSIAEEERGGLIHKKMEGNYLTSGDLAMWDTARTSRAGNYYGDGYGCGYGYGHRHDGMAATGIGLGAGLGSGALLLAIAGIWGVNQASKARARGAENLANANAKTVELLASIVNREATRQDGVNVDVQQTLRSQAYTSAYGGGANAASNALATAEAQALLLNGGLGNSRSGQVCPQPVALYQPAMPCRCNTCGD